MKLSRQLLTFALALATASGIFAQNQSQAQTTPPTTTEANKAQTGTANQQQNPTTDPTDTTSRQRQATGSQSGSQNQAGTQTSGSQSDKSDAGTHSSTGGQATGSHAGTGSTAGQSTGAATTGDRNRTATAGAADMVSPTDRRFMMKVAESSMAEIQMAQGAQTKATSDTVKQVARTIEQDHTQASTELKRIAGMRNIDLPSAAPMQGKHHQAMQKLDRASNYDRAFLQEAIRHHRADIKEFERYSKNGMDTELKTFAENQLPTLRKHLQAAESAMAEVKSGGSRSRTRNSATGTGNTGSTDNAAGSTNNNATGSTSGNTGDTGKKQQP